MAKIALAVHGGAGTILKSLMTDDLEAEYRSGLVNALKEGWAILSKGGSSMDAVEQTVCALEDFHLFNAGRGSVFTNEGKNEMDACIMDGANLRAGSVAFVRNVKNPVKLARLVMENTEHVLLAGEGANQFAAQMNVEVADDAYFFTEHRYEQLLRARDIGAVQLDHTVEEPGLVEVELAHSENGKAGKPQSGGKAVRKPLGTVGAVACDSHGNLAAATSTGGMTNKKFGRIGDTPLVGLGNYAENSACAVSCTGHGEYFMLGVAAYDVAARMKYKQLDLETAASETIDHLAAIGGEGGLIAVDADANVALTFNSDGMYRGYISAAGGMVVDIYR